MSLTDTPPFTDRLPAGLLARIVKQLDPIRVFLFGSQATGHTHCDSDWDLFIVMDDNAPTERINWLAMYEARRGIRGAIDLIPCRETNFRNRKDIVGSLPWTVCQEGILVYERSDER